MNYGSQRQEARVWYFPPAKKYAFVFEPSSVRNRDGKKGKDVLKNFTLLLSFKYNATYNAGAKAWLFDESRLDEFLRTAEKYVGHVKVERKISLPPPVVAAGGPDPWLVFTELTGASRSASGADVKKAYYRAVQRLHPDLGGDAAKMTELNVAWSAIRKELSL